MSTGSRLAEALREFEVYAAETGLNLTRFDGVAAPWCSVETSRHWQTWRAALAAHEAEQAAEAQPVAFVHWPMSGAPRLVWYSNKALEDAIRKARDDHQPDLLLYTRPLEPLTDEQISKGCNYAIELSCEVERAAFRKGVKFAEDAHRIGKGASHNVRAKQP
jgi:hypothetical protein